MNQTCEVMLDLYGWIHMYFCMGSGFIVSLGQNNLVKNILKAVCIRTCFLGQCLQKYRNMGKIV